MKEITYTSFLGKDITEYVRFKCSLGYSASTYDEALRRFDTFCAENYPSEDTVTEQIVNRWLEKRPGENTNGHIRRMITLKGFLKFLKARKCPELSPGAYCLKETIRRCGSLQIQTPVYLQPLTSS